MQPDVRKWIELLWIGFMVVWFVGAFMQKEVARREPARSQLMHLALAVVAWLLIFDEKITIAPLDVRFLPNIPLVGYIGLALTFLGIVFAVWARVFLGGNWSGTVTIKKDHELVRNGPYALVRHPIYTGILVALLGTSAALRATRSGMAFGVVLLALWLKSRREESFMMEQFGAAYAEYKQKVKCLIPFVW